MKPTIILIHGAWLTPLSFEPFKNFFETKGYTMLVPVWPERVKDGKHIGITELVEYFARYIRALPEPPVLIGHSFGGLFVQMLLDQGLGRAGIAIDSVPPKGVFRFYPSVVRSVYIPFITFMGWRTMLTMPFSVFQYSFANNEPISVQQEWYKKYMTCETGRIFWQLCFSVFSSITRVHFKNNKRAPLLLIASGLDHVVPARMNKNNYIKYARSTAVTNFKLFPNRCHFTIVQNGFEDVAGYCEEWVAHKCS